MSVQKESSLYKHIKKDNGFENVTLKVDQSLVKEGDGGGLNVFGEIKVNKFICLSNTQVLSRIMTKIEKIYYYYF